LNVFDLPFESVLRIWRTNCVKRQDLLMLVNGHYVVIPWHGHQQVTKMEMNNNLKKCLAQPLLQNWIDKISDILSQQNRIRRFIN